MNDYRKDRDFLNRLMKKIIVHSSHVYSEAELSKLQNSELSNALDNLDPRRLDVLIKKLAHKNTLKQISIDLKICLQRVWQLEQTAYQILLERIMDKPNEILWEDRALISTRCTSKTDIAIALKSLTPGLVNSLRANGYGRIDQLCSATPKRLMTIYGIGWGKMTQIEQAVINFKNQNPDCFLYDDAPNGITTEDECVTTSFRKKSH